MTLLLRRFEVSDAAGCFHTFYDSVHLGAAPHYSEVQRKAWAPTSQMPAHWPEKLLNQACWVAETEGDIVGFMSLESDGHLDMAYVAPRFRQTKVADDLYVKILQDARHLELPRLFTEASHLARSFFQKRGWAVTKPETIIRRGIAIDRFQMAIDL